MEMLLKIHELFDTEMDALEAVKKNLSEESVKKVIEILLNSSGKVVITGIGKSGLIGQKMAATFSSTGTPSIFLNAAEALHGDLGVVTPQDVVLLISNSGNAEEMKTMIPVLKIQQIPTIAITGNPNSFLAKECDVTLMVSVPKEGCPLNLAPMASTTATLVLGDALAALLMQLKNFQPEHFARYHPAGALGRRLLLQVTHLMKRGEEIAWVLPTATMQEVIEGLTEKKLGLVLVTRDFETLLGIITEGDLRRALKRQDEFFSLSASDIMTRSPIMISSKLFISEALEVMENRESQISVLPVIDHEKVVGVLRLHDAIGQVK